MATGSLTRSRRGGTGTPFSAPELRAVIAWWITGKTVTRETSVRAWSRARPFFVSAGLLLLLAAFVEARFLLLQPTAPPIWAVPVYGSPTWETPSNPPTREQLLPADDAELLLTALHRRVPLSLRSPMVQQWRICIRRFRRRAQYCANSVASRQLGHFVVAPPPGSQTRATQCGASLSAPSLPEIPTKEACAPLPRLPRAAGAQPPGPLHPGWLGLGSPKSLGKTGRGRVGRRGAGQRIVSIWIP